MVLLAGLVFANSSQSAELKTRLTRLEYQQSGDLQLLQQQLQLGLRPVVPGQRRALTVEEAISNKVDLIFGRVREILEMYPDSIDFRIVLLPTEIEVQQQYQQIYAKKSDYIAFFSPQTKSVYFALNKVNLQVFAHELSHVVINAYFLNSPPEKIHEVLAQYVEKQFR